ncbi:TPA: flagellar hook-length control protein FliK [Legionella feeleii]
MVDLIQLASIQPTAKELDLACENDAIEGDKSLQDNTAFIAILEHLLLDEVSASGVINQEKNINQQEKAGTESPEQMELINTTEFGDNSYINQTIDEEKSIETSNKINEQKDEIDLITVDNPQLAWFNASSFEAPGVNLELSLEEVAVSVNQLIPSNQQALNGQEIGKPPLIIPERGNEVTGESTAVKLDKPITQELSLVKPTSDYSSNTTHLQTLFEQIRNSESSIPSVVSEKNLLESASEDIEMFVIEQRSDKNLAAIMPALTNHPNMQTPTTVTVPAKVIELSQSVVNPEWGNEFNQQIIWIGQQKIKSATIKLNPQELGPLEVSIKVVKEAATVNITTHSAPVRDLIEQALPRLRDMMAEQGINLSQVNIESNNNHRQQSPQYDEKIRVDQEVNDEQALATTSLTARVSKRLIDYFA